MATNRALISTLLAVALVAGSVGPATGAMSGFAFYSVQLSSHGATRTFTVNETVTTSSRVGTDTFLLKVMSSSFDLSYSKSINSSLQVQPFLPSLANQSFTFGANSTRLSVSLVHNGTTSFAFQGSIYSLASYSFSSHFSVRNLTRSSSGSILAFPSGLLYSLKDSDGVSSLAITLTSTSLPLTVVSPSPPAQALSLGVGLGVAGAALALALGVRSRHRKHPPLKDKPEYWVD